MLNNDWPAVQWNLNLLLSRYSEECAHRLLYVKGSFWKYTLVLTYCFYWIFFFLQFLWSLYWLYIVEFGSSVGCCWHQLLSHNSSTKSYCTELAPVNGNEKWDEERLISLQFYFLYFLAEAVPKWQNFGRKCSINEQKYKNTKAILYFFMLSSSSV